MQAQTLALSDLPWDDLHAMLDPSTVLLDVANPQEACEQECTAVIEKGFKNPALGCNCELKDQASGVCVAKCLCGLANCGLCPNDDTAVVDEWIRSVWTDPTCDPFDSSNDPQHNVPSKVLFPQVAGDAVSAVKFAKEHLVESSVKNSGHSCTGASTKKDTLHLNMRNHQKHSSKGTIVCQQDDTVVDDALNNQPCKLALAQNKPAMIRMGGGENWNMVCGNVKACDEQQDTCMCHAVGGSAGSVSPMGWTWQGGLAGNTGGRMCGFGVDQVLQTKMILPSGLHVKFGPTEWTDDADADAIHPKTTKASGVCFEEDTETWGTCQEDVNFNDLWFVLRGGLGGSWGVILSVFLQLHLHQPLETLKGLTCETFTASPVARDICMRFVVDCCLDPSDLGVSKDDSIKCGAASEVFTCCCCAEGAGDLFLSTWQNCISGHDQTLQEELTIEQVNSHAGCFFKEEHNDKTESHQIEEGPSKGNAGDDGSNLFGGAMPLQNILIPKKWIPDDKDKAVSLMGTCWGASAAAAGSGASSMCFAFDGVEASDQANALSDAHHNAGFMMLTPVNLPHDVSGIPTPPIASFFHSELLPEMHDMTDSNSFPGCCGSNHAKQASPGPLRSNWTQPCPLDWTEKERDGKCISTQEAIHGAELLDRLESIKEAIVPHCTFDCNRCVGNNCAITSQPEPGDDDNSNSGVTTATTASFLFTGAAALVSFFIVF